MSISSMLIVISVDGSNAAPVISNCPGDQTATLPTTSSQVQVFWTAPTATDDGGTPALSSNYASGTFFNYGTTTVTYTATDSQGLTATCTFFVTVNGTVA